MIVGIDQTTWDLIAQIGTWLIGFPLLIGILGAYIAAQIAVERRENQKLDGRWGLAADARRGDSER